MWQPESILTFDTKTKEWSKTKFDTFSQYRSYILSMWKTPGEYNFRNTEYWIQPGIKFQKDKRYCDYHPKSKEYKQFWLEERRKCIQGIIVDDRWISPDMYFFWNYCPIFDKLQNDVRLPRIWDSHYHYDLHCQLAFLFGEDVAMTKSRQKGVSLYHVARMTRKLWFNKKNTLKIVGHEEIYVQDEWSIMEGYRNHLNEHTGWYRHFSPSESLNWEQKREVTEGVTSKKKIFKGNKSKIKGLTTKMNVTKAVGGCMRKGEQVFTTEGLKNIENIKIGDYVFGIDGKQKKVIRLFTGEDDIYKIKQKYGEDYHVNGDHKLVLQTGNKRFKNKIITPTVKEWIELSKHSTYKRSYSGIKINTPLEFNKQEIKIDPYLLGVWLGDGYSRSARIIVNKTKDPEILDFLKNSDWSQSISIRRKESKRYNEEIYIVGFKNSNSFKKDNLFLNELRLYNLINNKHVPKEYIFNTPEIRLNLLAGLIDTDGTYNKKRQCYEISSSKKDFIYDVKFLCTSLGIYNSVRKVKSKSHPVKENLIKESHYYILRLTVPENLTIPTKVKRKQSIIKRKKIIGVTPVEIEKIGYERYYGFECEDHLYVLKDGTITHNSASEIYITEAGVNPKLKKIKEFVDPNMKMGNVKTGLFCAAGAVGELKDCEDLMEYCFNPKKHNIRAVKDIFSGTMDDIAFFFPEEWNYTYQDEETGEVIICYDKDGNSDIELARSLIQKEDLRQRQKDEQSYKLWKSQHPRTLQDAFDQREDNPFPTEMLKEQEFLVLNKKEITVELVRDINGKITHKFSDRTPIAKLKPNPNEDNRGVIVVREFPIDKPPFGLYYAGVDPIYNLDTSTSSSLMSVRIWIGTHEKDGKISEPYPVAWYIGRHPNVRNTYQICIDLIEWYNARTAVESNVKDFTEWCIREGKSKYLMRRRELTVINEMFPNSTIQDEIGVRMTGDFKNRALERYIAWLQTPIATSFNMETGEGKDIYNVSKISDPLLIKEMLRWTPKLNTDRLVSDMLALIACQSDTNRHVITSLKNPLEVPKNPYEKKLTSVFKHKPVIKHSKIKGHFG